MHLLARVCQAANLISFRMYSFVALQVSSVVQEGFSQVSQGVRPPLPITLWIPIPKHFMKASMESNIAAAFALQCNSAPYSLVL